MQDISLYLLSEFRPGAIILSLLPKERNELRFPCEQLKNRKKNVCVSFPETSLLSSFRSTPGYYAFLVILHFALRSRNQCIWCYLASLAVIRVPFSIQSPQRQVFICAASIAGADCWPRCRDAAVNTMTTSPPSWTG